MSKHLAPEPERRPLSLGKRVALVAGVVALAAISIIAGFSVAQHRNPIQMMTQAFVPSPQQTFKKKNLLILVVGLDYDYNEKDEEYSTQARSDVIKAINLDFDRKQVYEISVPRDMVATLPSGRKAKINEAQAEGGIKEAQSVIASWLGIPRFDRYVMLRINSMKEIINAIGGVNVTVKTSDCIEHHECQPGSLDYVDTWGHLNIHLKTGTQHLSGDQAVGYARFRHDWCGDPCRLQRQDQVVRAMIDKLKGDKLNTLMHLNSLISVINSNVTTNLTQAELFVLASYFADSNPSAVHQAQVPYVNDVTLADGSDAIIPDERVRAKLVQTMLVAPPLPEPSADPLRVAEIVPATVQIDIQNGSGVRGAAHKLASALQKQGFKIGSVGNAPTEVAATEIHEHSETPFAGARVRLALPAAMRSVQIINDGPATATPSGAPTSDVTVIIGPASSHS